MSSIRKLLVLGGTSGIGQAVANLAGPEFNLIRAVGLEDFDIRDYFKYAALLREFEPTDIVYSVGVNALDWIHSAMPTDFARLMEVNVWGFIQLVQFLDGTLRGPRNIVAVTSDAAWRPMRTSVNYCASKAALEMAVRVASREYAPHGWRINAVAPGKVADTAMTDYVDNAVRRKRGWTAEEAEAYELASSPLGRKITKAEVADVILATLNGPAAQTGEIIAVNGGR